MTDFTSSLEMIEELGPIIEQEQLCPGIYLLTVKNDEELLAREYYAVTEESTIPTKAKSYGREFPDLWLFSLDGDGEQYKIIKYEIAKYRTQNHLPLDEPLRATAFFAAQSYPEYFGAFPVPLHTPRGVTVRHWILDNGIYWIETDQCEELLAVSYPVWASELSDPVAKLGEITEYDAQNDIEETLGYIFFPMEISCIPLRELMQNRSGWAGTVIDKAALMNALWKVAPDYSLLLNQREQLGLNDGIATLLAEFDMKPEPHIALDHVIAISPGAGDAFLLLEGR